MSGVLVIAEARRGELRDVTFELVTAGLRAKEAGGGPVTVAVIAADPAAHADALNAAGVDEVVTVRSPSEHFEPHVHAKAVEALIGELAPTLVLAAHTVDSMGFAPAVAATGGHGLASDVIGVELGPDGPVARRGAYGDRLVATLAFPGKQTVVLMLRPGAYEAAARGGGSAQVREVAVALDDAAVVEHVGFREADAGDVDITKADFLLSVGRGVEEEDQLEQFAELAEEIGATLAVSRPLVDSGWAPAARQVGQSGKTVAPKVYLALGISGAVQHLTGMRNAETIIAVNTDPEAPIFGAAHYGAVVDMFELAEALPKHFG
jgi:electron transfer flavoprotein alpha subunit